MNAIPQNETLAVFDLDGTLLRRDSFLPFLITYAWRERRKQALWLVPLYVALYLARRLSDRDAKERLLIAIFADEPVSKIRAHARWFCTTWIVKHLRTSVTRVLSSHQAGGDRVVLVSASPDLYVCEVAALLGIVEVICTRVKITAERCDGRLAGPNCKGHMKLELLQQFLTLDTPPQHSFAYGDAQSDLPLLRWVRHGFLVRRNRLIRVRPVAKKHSTEIQPIEGQALPHGSLVVP